MKTLSSEKLSVVEMERAWAKRDASYDGVFFLGVRTTGIACRPSCPSQPKREHLEFFLSLGEAITAGYRPCKRCRPELANGQPPEWISRLMQRVAENPEATVSGADLRADGLTPEKVRRWFLQNYGMTFAAWCRGQRLSRAFTSIRNGAPLDDVILGNGYDSHSGFREAFNRAFGTAPGKSREKNCLRVTLLATPIGPMLAAANESAICQLEFADVHALEHSYAAMKKHFGLPVVPGNNEVLTQLTRELNEYFDGKRKNFSVPFVVKGTSFQEGVWRELCRIPYGETASYADIATRVKHAGAVRAVARANATNRLCLIVPCHRVIASDGSLSGYGGGVWRKRLLLELEQGQTKNR